MPNTSTSKLKPFYLLRILQEETDSKHGLSMAQIIERLKQYGIPAERKSIYADLRLLRELDYDIKAIGTSPTVYALDRHDFSLDDLMLMVDAIQSCRAITARQAKLLTANIMSLASNHEQELLERRIHVTGRIKSKNESAFGNVDLLHEAMRHRCKVEFVYLRLGMDGKRHKTKGGKKRIVSPLEIAYEEGFYYLTSWDEDHDGVTEYRIDRMASLALRPGDPAARGDAGLRTAENVATFGRFIGEPVEVTLSVHPEKIEIVTDRFGTNVTFEQPVEGRAMVVVDVHKSEQFFGWVAGLGGAVRIARPEPLIAEYKDYLRFLLDDTA